MSRLVLCPSCQTHVLAHEVGCPHCGAELKTIAAPRSSLMLLGLALAACPAGDDGDTGTTAPTTTAPTTTTPTTSTTGETTSSTTDDTISGSGDVEYGAPDTFDTSDTQVDTTTSSSGPSDSSGSTGSSGSGEGTTTGLDSAGEPEYGVPESG